MIIPPTPPQPPVTAIPNVASVHTDFPYGGPPLFSLPNAVEPIDPWTDWPAEKSALLPEPVAPVRGDQLCYRLPQAVYRYLLDELTSRPPEYAGLLMALSQDTSLITGFVPDDQGTTSSTTCDLDGPFLTDKVQQYKQCGMTGIGVCHSHPASVQCLSQGDVVYARRLMGNPKNSALSHLFMPIVCGTTLFPYVVMADGTVSTPQLILI